MVSVNGITIVSLLRSQDDRIHSNDRQIKREDRIAIEFCPEDLENLEFILKIASERCTRYCDQQQHHGWVNRIREALNLWQEERNRIWAKEHPEEVKVV